MKTLRNFILGAPGEKEQPGSESEKEEEEEKEKEAMLSGQRPSQGSAPGSVTPAPSPVPVQSPRGPRRTPTFYRRRVFVPNRPPSRLMQEERRIEMDPAYRSAAAKTGALVTWAADALQGCDHAMARATYGGAAGMPACRNAADIADYLARQTSAMRMIRTDAFDGRWPYDEEGFIPRPYPDPDDVTPMAELLGARFPPIPELPAYAYAWSNPNAVYAWWRAQLINSAMPMALIANDDSLHAAPDDLRSEWREMSFAERFGHLVNEYVKGTLAGVMDTQKGDSTTIGPILAPFASMALHTKVDIKSPKHWPGVETSFEGQYAIFYALAAAHTLHLTPDSIVAAIKKDDDLTTEEKAAIEARAHGDAVSGFLLSSGRLSWTADPESPGVLAITGDRSFLAAVATVSWSAVMPTPLEQPNGRQIAGAYLLAGELLAWRHRWYHSESAACALTLALASAHMDAVDEKAHRMGTGIEIYTDREFHPAERVAGPYADYMEFLQKKAKMTNPTAEQMRPYSTDMTLLWLLQAILFDEHLAVTPSPAIIDIDTRHELARMAKVAEQALFNPRGPRDLKAYVANSVRLAGMVPSSGDPWKGPLNRFVPPSVSSWPIDPRSRGPQEALADAVEILSGLS